MDKLTDEDEKMLDHFQPSHKGHPKMWWAAPGVNLSHADVHCHCGMLLRITMTAIVSYLVGKSMRQAFGAPYAKPLKDDVCCRRCGDAGEWRTMALVCRNGHGNIIG